MSHHDVWQIHIKYFELIFKTIDSQKNNLTHKIQASGLLWPSNLKVQKNLLYCIS